MAVSISFNGVVYSIPQVGDESWGESLTSYFTAIPQGALQKTGGTFTLTAEVNFGATYGLLSQYYKSRSSNISTAGILRLAVGDTIGWRNNANDGNLLLSVDGSDRLVFNGTSIISNAITALTGDVTATGPGSVAATISANAVTDAKFRQSAALSIVGNATNATANVADITAGTDGFVLRRNGTALEFALLTNSNISASAAIDFSKLAALTSGYILVGNGSNVAAAVTVSGDITISNAGVTAIGANKVTLGMMAQIATTNFLGRLTAGTGDVESLTPAEATSLLAAFVGDSGAGGTKGLVPAPAAGDAAAEKYLKADGNWDVPAGAGTVTSVGLSAPSFLSVANSPVTTTGTLALSLADQVSGTFFAGPDSGADAAPTFRAPVRDDISPVYLAPTVQKFTSGSGTYTRPSSPSPLYIKVRMVGGGGGGSGSGTSGSAGAGGAGGDTTFGTTLLSAGGGSGGTAVGAGGAGGAGGSSSLGTGPIGTALSGCRGGYPSGPATGATFPRGLGAASALGGGTGGSWSYKHRSGRCRRGTLVLVITADREGVQAVMWMLS
jgi:hypothetical protein